MPLGTEVGLGQDDIVLDGDPAPLSKKGAEPPIFGPFLLWPNDWMDKDATWYGGKPQPRQYCVRWGPSSPPPRKKVTAPNFRPMYIVAKRLHVRLPLGTEEGLSLGAQPPNFGQCPLWPNGWMD